MNIGSGRSLWGMIATGCALSLGMSCSLVSTVCAQTATDGAIGGRVLSAAGAPVEGALVMAHELETGLTLRAITDAKGEFLVTRLPVGEYAVNAVDAGIELTLPGPIEVELGEVTEVEARMQTPAPGKSNFALVARKSMDASELAALPVNGGDYSALAETVAGANQAARSEDGGDVSFRGVSEDQNSTRMDGTSSDESFAGVRSGGGVADDPDAGSDNLDDRSSANGGRRSGSAYIFSQAAVREFRTHAQLDAVAYGSAMYGHGVGGVVTTVSRSGGSRLHGMVFYTVRDSGLAATNPFSIASTYANGVVTNALVKPLDIRQQFGGRVGGPLLEREVDHPANPSRGIWSRASAVTSRLFYFYAFDEQRRNFPAVSGPGYAGFYSLTATQQALLANRGVTPTKTTAALNYLNSLTGTVPRRADQTVNFGRLDWDRASGSRIVLEYNRARWSSPAGMLSAPVVDRGVASIGSSYGKIDAAVARWVQFLTPALSNELRLQYGRELQYEAAQTPLPQEPAVGPGGMPPEISIGSQGFAFGTPAALGKKAYPDERRLEAADVLGWVHGRHFLQLGADFSALRDITDSLSNAEGTFSYDSGATNGKAGGLVDWITDYTFSVHAYPNGGCPSINSAVHDFCFRSYSQSFGQQSLSFDSQEWAAFVQDDWRVSQRLTVHAGVRFEYEFLPLPQQPNARLDAVFGAIGSTGIFPEDRNNLGPRLGLEWQPFGVRHGVVRAGYGVYFGKLPGASVRAALLDTALPGSATHVRILPSTETACPQVSTVGFGYACSFLAAPNGVVTATTSALMFDHAFRLPMVQQGTLSIEHELGWGVLGTADYVMNIDRQLPNSVDINIAPATNLRQFQLQGGTGSPGARDGETFTVPIYSARVSSSFGPVTALMSNANATYHGLTVEAQRGLGGRRGLGGVGQGLEFRLAWTWSKAIDEGQNTGPVPHASGQFDPFTIRYDKGLSALNFPQHVAATAVWSPRWNGGMVVGEAGARLRSVVNGWSVSGIFSEASGRSYSYDIFGGTRLSGGRESINGSGGSIVLPTGGRNTLRLPITANLDMRLTRNFRLSETMRLRGSIEGFNVINRQNYSGVTQRAYMVGTPGTGTAAPGVTPLVFQNAATVAAEGLNVRPFGAYTEAGHGLMRERQIQMGLRFEF